MSQLTQEKVYIGAQVDRRQRDAIVQLARKRDRSVSSIIRRALAAELATKAESEEADSFAAGCPVAAAGGAGTRRAPAEGR